jgi:RNA 3'-terminal phosphate cyclase (ATP)
MVTQRMADSSWIEIDGSQGEGGGQMVRSSLALSMVTGKPVRISNVRAGREKPGLMRQHLTCVQAAAEVCGANVTGDTLGSSSISFEPQAVKPGEYHFRIGTAGSASLVIQTLLPALILGDKPSTIVVEGGTHNIHAPPFEFLQKAFLPLVNRMGPRIQLSLEQYGFYPAGGGELRATIQSAPYLKAYDIAERGEFTRRQVSAVVARLPIHIAQREVDVIRRGLNWDSSETTMETVQARCPGNFLWMEFESQHVTEVITGFGRLNVKAEVVARDAMKEARDYIKSNVPIGIHLADQWMLPLAITKRCRRRREVQDPKTDLALHHPSRNHREVSPARTNGRKARGWKSIGDHCLTNSRFHWDEPERKTPSTAY